MNLTDSRDEEKNIVIDVLGVSSEVVQSERTGCVSGQERRDVLGSPSR